MSGSRPSGTPAVRPATGLADLSCLERADWRFLLPAPPGGTFRHFVVLGGPAGLAAALCASGAARRVGTELPAGAGVDALALLLGAGVEPAEAVRCLAPGGLLYYESADRRSLRAPTAVPGRAVERLRACGLTVLGLWAVYPGFAGYEAYLPVDAPGALPWFARTLYLPPTLRGRLTAGGVRLLGRSRLGGALLTKSFALTAVAGPADGRRPALLEHPALPAELQAADSLPLLLNHGRERVALLPFPRRGACPAAVLKVPRLAAYGGKTVAEQEALVRVRALLDPATGSALPRPGGVLSGAVPVAVESYSAGRPLVRSGVGWGTPLRRKIGDLRLAGSWLAELHRQTEERRTPWGRSEAAELVERPCALYRARLGATAAEERLFAAARERAAALAGLPLPTVLRHRDFTPWNLLREGRRLEVIDWEGARPGPPLADLLHFVTHWHELARRAFVREQRIMACQDLFVRGRRGAAERAARQAIAAYCRRLAIDPRFVSLLLVHTWVEIALRPFEGPAAEASAGARPAGADYVAALAEGVDGLFAARFEERFEEETAG